MPGGLGRGVGWGQQEHRRLKLDGEHGGLQGLCQADTYHRSPLSSLLVLTSQASTQYSPGAEHPRAMAGDEACLHRLSWGGGVSPTRTQDQGRGWAGSLGEWGSSVWEAESSLRDRTFRNCISCSGLC